MRKILTLFTLSLLLIGCSKKEDVTVISNNELNDLQALVEVADYFYTNSLIDKTIVKKVEDMIYRKVIGVRALQPDISKLNGASLKGLCAVVAISKKSNFGQSINDTELTQLVINYLSTIEPALKASTNELKKTIFTSNDCAI